MTSVKWNCFNQIDIGDWKRRISDSSLRDPAVQECGDVARTLRHRYDLDGAAVSDINNEVRSDRPEQRSHTRLPALAGFALQTRADFGRVYGFATIQGGQASTKLELSQLGSA